MAAQTITRSVNIDNFKALQFVAVHNALATAQTSIDGRTWTSRTMPGVARNWMGVEFGNEQGGTYEEACGLDEPNTRSTYTTIINRVTQKYTKIAKYRTDTYGPE